jgi:hypothetical protein
MYRLLLASLLVIPLVSGCVYGTDAIRDEVDSIAWDLRPAELDTQAEIAFGRGILGMASTVARWSDDHDAEFAADMLDDIEKVDVGIYEVFGSGRHGPNGLTQDGLEELRDLGWRPVVRTSERRDGSRWVLYRTAPSGAGTRCSWSGSKRMNSSCSDSPVISAASWTARSGARTISSPSPTTCTRTGSQSCSEDRDTARVSMRGRGPSSLPLQSPPESPDKQLMNRQLCAQT